MEAFREDAGGPFPLELEMTLAFVVTRTTLGWGLIRPVWTRRQGAFSD
jgi:hypothetical protein